MTAPPKCRWFRISLRTMFVVVTLLAVALGQWNRAKSLRRLAMNALGLAIFNYHGDSLRSPESEARQLRQNRTREYHLAMAEKYRKAIWQPWVELLPDPEKPKG